MTDEPIRTLVTTTFLLFVAGDSPNSRVAVGNLVRALQSSVHTPADIEIVDVNERPEVASAARVMVTPTLLRRNNPGRRILGDLSVTGSLGEFLK